MIVLSTFLKEDTKYLHDLMRQSEHLTPLPVPAGLKNCPQVQCRYWGRWQQGDGSSNTSVGSESVNMVLLGCEQTSVDAGAFSLGMALGYCLSRADNSEAGKIQLCGVYRSRQSNTETSTAPTVLPPDSAAVPPAASWSILAAVQDTLYNTSYYCDILLGTQAQNQVRNQIGNPVNVVGGVLSQNHAESALIYKKENTTKDNHQTSNDLNTTPTPLAWYHLPAPSALQSAQWWNITSRTLAPHQYIGVIMHSSYNSKPKKMSVLFGDVLQFLVDRDSRQPQRLLNAADEAIMYSAMHRWALSQYERAYMKELVVRYMAMHGHVPLDFLDSNYSWESFKHAVEDDGGRC